MKRYTDAYVLARPNELNWLKPFLHKEIGHLVLVLVDINKNTVLIEPTIHGCLPAVLTECDTEHKLIEMVTEYGFKIMKLPKYNQCKLSVGYPGITGCVGFIKYAIGYPNISITPYQLWNRFIRDGATILTQKGE